MRPLLERPVAIDRHPVQPRRQRTAPAEQLQLSPSPNECLLGQLLREIRVNVVVRTRLNDPRNMTSAGTGQILENRTANVPGDDGRHRRIHTSTIRLRNVQS